MHLFTTSLNNLVVLVVGCGWEQVEGTWEHEQKRSPPICKEKCTSDDYVRTRKRIKIQGGEISTANEYHTIGYHRKLGFWQMEIIKLFTRVCSQDLSCGSKTYRVLVSKMRRISSSGYVTVDWFLALSKIKAAVLWKTFHLELFEPLILHIDTCHLWNLTTSMPKWPSHQFDSNNVLNLLMKIFTLRNDWEYQSLHIFGSIWPILAYVIIYGPIYQVLTPF